MKYFIQPFLPLLGVLLFISCSQLEKAPAAREGGNLYAIYSEYARDSNKLMHSGLNVRRFDTTDIEVDARLCHLDKNGLIHLGKGMWHITGFSIVTMQDSMTIPKPKYNLNYPGYALVCPAKYASDSAKSLENRLAVGSPGTALDGTPSVFDAVFYLEDTMTICVGHQSGRCLNNEVFVSVYEVDGTPSMFHLFAQIAIEKLD
jgi:hypothetical protein